MQSKNSFKVVLLLVIVLLLSQLSVVAYASSNQNDNISKEDNMKAINNHAQYIQEILQLS